MNINVNKAQLSVGIVSVLVALFFGFFEFSKKTEEVSTEQLVTYTGRVKNAHTDLPVRNAKIIFDYKNIPLVNYTDSEGVYAISGNEKHQEITHVRVEAEDYITYERNILLVSNRSRIEEIKLIPIPRKTIDESAVKEASRKKGGVEKKKSETRPDNKRIYQVKLYLPSEMHDADIFINGTLAAIASETLTVKTVLLIEGIYLVTAKNNDKRCDKKFSVY